MVAPNSALVFNVRRSEPALVRPAQPTPNEVKSLSCEDNNMMNKHQLSCILFYQATTELRDKDPAKVMKMALAEALVHYYPWAGRLKEAPDGSGSLVVDCTAEGVGFVEANADVRLEQFGGDSIQPPFPCIQELLYYKASSITDTIGCPIFAMQVTRLLCGGFIVTFTFSHVMSDAKGVCQFIAAITDLARGAKMPSVQPIWERELLNACDDPPCVTCATVINKFGKIIEAKSRDAYQAADDNDHSDLKKTLTYRSFFFGQHELDALRSHIPNNQLHGSCSAFDLITASMFRSSIIALQLSPEEEVRLLFIVDIRRQLAIPDCYYGNACVPAFFVCPAGEACSVGSLGYLVEQLKKAKAEVTEEYARSFYAMQGLCPIPNGLNIICTDWTRSGFSSLDFGWGKPVYAGTTGFLPERVSCIIALRNGRLLSLCLPADAMDRFSTALHSLIHGEQSLAN